MELAELGGRIRTLREHKGFTQQHLASTLNVTAQAVSKWERGDNAPDLFLMPELAAILNTSIDALMGYERRAIRSVEGTLLFAGLSGYTAKGEKMDAEDLAVYLNGYFYLITECVVHRSGLPIKYIGDAFLAIFIAGNHRENAVRAALAARSVCAASLVVGINTGYFYMGPIGHPDFARLDVIGDSVNVASRIETWAGQHTDSHMAASAETISGCPADILRGEPQEIDVKGKAVRVSVREILPEPG